MKMKTRGAFPMLLLTVASLLARRRAAGGSCKESRTGVIPVTWRRWATPSPYHFASWTSDSPCCDWYDVDCDDATGRVVGLAVFQDGNITGTIPDAVAGLAQLQNLMFSRRSRAPSRWQSPSSPTSPPSPSPGPPSPGQCVPSFLGALKKLTLLDISFNSLAHQHGSTIPASLDRRHPQPLRHQPHPEPPHRRHPLSRNALTGDASVRALRQGEGAHRARIAWRGVRRRRLERAYGGVVLGEGCPGGRLGVVVGHLLLGVAPELAGLHHGLGLLALEAEEGSSSSPRCRRRRAPRLRLEVHERGLLPGQPVSASRSAAASSPISTGTTARRRGNQLGLRKACTNL
ncbi:unnamed protein product [Urochloa humidicola]